MTTIKNIQLFHCDCIEGLEKVKNKSVQLVCIDPPYNIGKDRMDDNCHSKT